MSTLALKIVAICSMLLDHTLKVLPVEDMLEVWWGVPPETSAWLPAIFEPLGRLAMPIFAFCVAEGCRHTRSPKRYLLRLGVFALVSEIPFRLAFTAPSREQDVYALHVFRFWPPVLTSVIATLFLGAVACLAYKKLTEKGHRLLGLLPLLPCLLLAEFMHADYGGWGVLLVFLPFALEKKKYYLPALGVALTLLYERMGLRRQSVADRVPAGRGVASSLPFGNGFGRTRSSGKSAAKESVLAGSRSAVGVADPSTAGAGEPGQIMEGDPAHRE